MESHTLTSALSASIQEELSLWAIEMPTFKTGYDFETAFAKRMQKITTLLLQTSLDNEGSARNKKK